MPSALIDQPLESVRLTQKQAAQLIGKSDRFLRLGEVQAKVPRDDDGYPLVDLVRWHVDHELDVRVSDTPEALNLEKLRKLRRENDLAEGNLIDRNQFTGRFQAFTLAVREFGDQLARKNKLTGPQIQALFNEFLMKTEASLGSI